MEIIKTRHGYINLLVNNAGVALNLLPKLPTPKDGDIKSYQQALWNAGSSSDFSKTFEVNTTAIWYTTVAFLELLDAGNKRGNAKGMTSQVISVTSGGGFRKDEKVYSMSYTLSKAAATHLGKMLAHFLKDWNIRSNVIAPGVFPSSKPSWIARYCCLASRTKESDLVMTEGLITDAGMKAAVPLGRAGNMDDMGGLVLFLASKVGSQSETEIAFTHFIASRPAHMSTEPST